MLDRSLRVYKERLLEPIAVSVGEWATPVMISWVGFGIGVAAGLVAWRGWYGLALALWLLNRVFDGLDGTVARQTGQQTDFGGYLDIVLDDVVYSWVILALALSVGSVAAYIAAGAVLVMFRVNAASWMVLSSILEKRAQGAQRKGEMTSITMPVGLIEGTETILLYALFLSFPQWLVSMYTVFVTLIIAMVVQRLLWAHSHLQ